MKKLYITAAAAALFSAAALAAPQGFNGGQGVAGGPQGFNNAAPNTVAAVKSQAYDDQIVTLQGRLTKHLQKDHYEFTDLQGNTIEVELDDDQDWSNIAKDQLIEIVGEVDKDLLSISIDVKRAVPVQQ
ncbi:MAG: NirD/YgiW/YdeI family stress tolerance protein [Proteobacteria bacterium]|uniref:NirD/YgiW/YdeI family stress tolerance protein n=1 Tax=Candidatus Avisuccinivibrio stercorigallinarum TaxID=2840704 RepID=A0A9D9DB33_9GAMM|nr:NirD/YgiW/YdeI family stress tolerance protein [Candidatus Avisuccinivibrio stercorigallinarum]